MATVKQKEVFDNDQSYQELYDRIVCDTGLIFVDTPEETRLIKHVFKKFREHKVQFWSLTQGLIEVPGTDDPERFLPHDYPSKKARVSESGQVASKGNFIGCLQIIEEDCRKKIQNEEDTEVKTIYVLRDADKFLDAPGPLRGLRDIIYLASCSGSCMIISGFGVKVPSDLEKDSSFIKIKYPMKDEIKNKIIPEVSRKIQNHNKMAIKENQINCDIDPEKVSNACAGLTEDQILNTIAYSTTIKKEISTDLILEEKKAIINKSDILEYWICSDSLDNIGGFDELKTWFAVKKICMTSPHAADFKVNPPKGILLLGTQGSGKTAIGKAVAQSWGVGLIKFDMGKVFAGLVGESEKRMRMALAQVDAAGGVVLIDEIDKGLSGAGSSDKTDGGTTSRVIGTLLTWLQESHPGVFLIATANDITNLRRNHPELLRKGRFDEIWFSDSPTAEERKEIYRIHLQKRGRDPKRIDLDILANHMFEDDSGDRFGLVGAEIEHSIVDAIQEKFAEGGGKKLELNSKDDITTEDILTKIKLIKPMSWIAKDTIGPMRKWSGENARKVSSLTDSKKKEKGGKGSTLNMRSVETDVDIS